MTTTLDHRAESREFLAQARAELAQGDSMQASEKGWGAAAQMVKAVAQQRGWEHQGHRQLFSAVRRLRSETANEDIRRLFDVANSLHVNFYEDWREPETIQEALDDVERFLNLLEPLL